jgi:uncharacterized membrane protein HdeD (DUF308 family)
MATRSIDFVQFPQAKGAQLWGWFVGIGATIAMLGLVASANLMMAAIAATYFIGALMFAGGILQLVHAFGVRRWKRAALWTLSGILYLGAAGIVLREPVYAAGFLTLFLAVALGASGITRALYALGHHHRGWGWLLASGLISVGAAIVIGMGWPLNAVWVLGMLLAVDLLFQGTMLMFVGFSLKSARV